MSLKRLSHDLCLSLDICQPSRLHERQHMSTLSCKLAFVAQFKATVSMGAKLVVLLSKALAYRKA